MQISKKSVAILGFHDGASGQVETWFEKVTGYEIVCFVYEAPIANQVDIEEENKKKISQRTEYPQNNMFKGRPFIVSLTWWETLLELGIENVLPLTPDNNIRYKQIQKCREVGLKLVSAIHPTVTILADAEIADGVWINAKSIIGYKAQIESGVIINIGCQIDHHNILKSCCQLAPGVIMAGHVTLWECCDVFTGAIIINRKQIGRGAIVGAGAVVVSDIPPYSTAVGVPARVIKQQVMI